MIYAEVSVARSLLKIAQAERLLMHACDTRLAKSRRALEYRKTSTLKHWHSLADWPPSAGELPQPGGGQDTLNIRQFIRQWVLTFADDSRAPRRLQDNPIFRSVVNRLIENTLKHSQLAKRKSADEDLSHDIIRALNDAAWLPAPAFSVNDFQGQLVAFLARRVDRELISCKSKRNGRTDQDVESLPDQSDPTGQDDTMNMIENLDIDCILSQLPDQQRVAFRLFMEHVPPARIATKMKISRSEVSNLLKHAKRYLASLPEVQEMNKT